MRNARLRYTGLASILAVVLTGCNQALTPGIAIPDKDAVRVLFLGNSLTAGNDLPAMVQAMARAGGVTLVYESRTPGGASLEDHWQDGKALGVLAGSHWDYLVLQQGPSSRPESQAHLRRWAVRWADEARKQGTTPALYMVWPFQGQANGFTLVSGSYRRAAHTSRSRLLAAGDAWEMALRDQPAVSLFQKDKLHPTRAGTYLAALVITQGLTAVRPSNVPSKLMLADGQILQIPEEQAKVLRRSAENAAEKSGPARFTDPPGEETAEAKRLIDGAEAALKSGKSATDILTDPAYLPVHPWPRFRKLMRDFAQSSQATIVTPHELGVPMVVTGRVIDSSGRPVKGAMVYVYHTSGKGWYSDRAAHIAAHEGDRKYARLFGYLRTDDQGSFELSTIRPAGYPDADLPAHIHVEVERPDKKLGSLVTEIQFDDDPRLTAEWRRRSQQENFVIAKVKKDAQGVQHVQIELRANW
jgi:protocatechuate 3,4-dioxygenase beta subunit